MQQIKSKNFLTNKYYAIDHVYNINSLTLKTGNMKFLVLNPPYYRNIIRKYSCSYFASGFLYPPVELLRVATIIKEKAKKKHEVKFIDAIAEKLNYEQCIDKIKNFNPDFLILLGSVDFINEEYQFCRQVKSEIDLKIILIGYLPDLFCQHYPDIDIILGNDFESIIGESFNNFFSNSNSYFKNLKELKNKGIPFNPDTIEKVDNSFVNEKLYSDLFVKGKTAFTYFSFGCPYKCSFCVKTYNLDRIYYRNTSNILKELLEYHRKKYKNIRILDDNCTINKKILFDILEFQNKNNIKFNYYGLSRMDLLDEETINLLIKLNFRRILIGIEAIKNETQNVYNKKINLDLDKIIPKMENLKRNKVEIFIFIMFNPLTDTKECVKETISFLKKLPINFASISYITPYPGTRFFSENIDHIDFSLKPEFKSKLKSKYYADFKNVKISFFINFYLLNIKIFPFFILKLINHPRQSFVIIKSFLTYFFSKDKKKENFF